MTDTASLLWGLLVTAVATLAVLVAAQPAGMFGRSSRGWCRVRAGDEGERDPAS